MSVVPTAKSTFNMEEISSNLEAYLSIEEIEIINSKADEIVNIINENPITSTTTVDSIRPVYNLITEKWQEYQKAIQDVQYNYPFQGTERAYIITAIKTKVEVNADNVFLVMRVRDKIVKPLHEQGGSGGGVLKLTFDNAHLLYHVMKDFKYNGIDNPDAILLAVLLAKVGAIEKIASSLVEYSNKISKFVTEWTELIDKLEEAVAVLPPVEGPSSN